MASFNNNTLIVALIAVLALCVGYSAAQNVRSNPTNSERVYDFTISEKKDSVSWTAFGREWTVRLTLSDVVEDNMDYFHGTLDGDVNAVVSFALLPGVGMSGMIATQSSTWWISAQPLPEHGFSEDEDKLGFFMIREAVSDLDPSVLPVLSDPVHVDEDDDVSAAEDEEAAADIDSDAHRKRSISSYKVAVYYDQKWAASSNPWRSQADTTALFNDINAIYKAAGLGQFSVVYKSQVSNPKSTLNDMLSYFSDTASKTLGSFKDSSFTNHLWLVGTNVGGLAYVGTSCKATTAANRKTAVAGLVSYSRLWTVKTIAHELAHNRGANHQFDNACSSTVKAGCQCSVMSYCFPAAGNNPSGAVNAFSSFSINEMKTKGCY
jgi:hypothetical protein